VTVASWVVVTVELIVVLAVMTLLADDPEVVLVVLNRKVPADELTRLLAM
jgi:hypothetical protein